MKNSNHSSSNNHLNHSLRLLQWFCPAHLFEEIEGDLLQKFARDLESPGPKSSDHGNPSDRLPTGQAGSQRSDGYWRRRAKRRLLWNVIRFCRPGILLRNKFSWHFNSFYMLGHFFKIFVRTMLKNKAYSFINISGLAVGLACSIFTLLWVMDEFAFDSTHRDKERIFTFRTNAKYESGIFTFPGTTGRLAEALKEFPEVEESARSVLRPRLLVNYKDQSFYEDCIYADVSLFSIFTLPLAEGN